MSEMIARYKPGQNVPGYAASSVTAGRFVKISADKTSSGDYSCAPAGAGEQPFGVAERDASSSEPTSAQDRRFNIVRRGAIARVVAAEAISAGGLVAVGSGGKAVAYVAPTLSGNSQALPNSPAIAGVACNTVAADGDIVEVDLF